MTGLVLVKVGGALLNHPADLDRVLGEIQAAATQRPVLVVPGGGPFADAVREVDRRVGLSDDVAHWIAILAMDQYAILLADRLRGALLVRDEREALTGLHEPRLVVLAPSAWLRAVDPLPHSWDITSDSIAAWMAGALGVRDLVLVKAPGAAGHAIVDPCFSRTLPSSVRATVVAADALDRLRSALRGEQTDPCSDDRPVAAATTGGAPHAGDVGAGPAHE
jgi:aspartokinase-like uncharacterized kinase